MNQSDWANDKNEKMKKILFMLILIVFGCKDKETELNEKTEKRKEKAEIPGTYEDAILDMDAEKLALLSIIKKIPNDTLHLVLKDYLYKTGFFIDNNTQVDKVIDTISQKYNIPKVKIASLLFSYKYEMLTKDEIEQNAIEAERDKQQE